MPFPLPGPGGPPLKNVTAQISLKGKGFNQETIDDIKKQIRAGCLGEDVTVEVNLVNEIPHERTGKLRAVVSNVKE